MAGWVTPSDRRDGNVGVVGGKELQVAGVVGCDDAATKADGGRHDQASMAISLPEPAAAKR